MENISSRTKNLQESSNAIHESIKFISEGIRESTVEIEDSHENLLSIKSRMKIMIYSNSLIQENSVSIKSKLGDGVSNMENSVHLIGELIAQNEELELTIKELWSQFTKLSHQVLDLTKLTEQSKMLALNAEIEAEHVGEAGKGFAIVAKEMGKLSESSSKTARDIIRKIKDLQEAAKLTELNVSGSVEFAKEANEQIHKANKIYNDINDSIQNVTDESSEFTKSFTDLDENIGKIDLLFKQTLDNMKNRVNDSNQVLEQTKNQKEETKAIFDYTNSTLNVSWTLNSIISLFNIPGFKTYNEQKKKLEDLLDLILSSRGLIVTLLYSKLAEREKFLFSLESNLHLTKELLQEMKNSSDTDVQILLSQLVKLTEITGKIFTSIQKNETEIVSQFFEKEFRNLFMDIVLKIIEKLGKLE